MKFLNLALALAALTSTAFGKDCKCAKGDVSCIAKCLGLPNPSSELAELTLECNASCTAEASDFDNCFETCVKDVYLKFTESAKVSTKTAESKTTEKTSESKTTESKTTESKTSESKSETKTTTITDKTTATETTDKSKSTDTSAKDTKSESKKSSSSLSRSAIVDLESSANRSQFALYSSVVVLASTALYYIL